MGSMLGQTTRCSTGHVTSYDEVCICATNPSWRFFRDSARTHKANLAAYTSNAKSALWLLFIKAIKDSITSHLLHAIEELADCWIWSFLHYLLLVRPGLAILTNGLHVIHNPWSPMTFSWRMSMGSPLFTSQLHITVTMGMTSVTVYMTMAMVVMMSMIMVMTVMVVTMIMARAMNFFIGSPTSGRTTLAWTCHYLLYLICLFLILLSIAHIKLLHYYSVIQKSLKVYTDKT